MRGTKILWIVCFAIGLTGGSAYSENPPAASADKQSNSVTQESVKEALAASALKAKTIHQDALRVWKKYKTGSKPNYSYYFWGRKIIFWLQKNKSIKFDSLGSVKSVFTIMENDQQISSDAVAELSKFVWDNIERRKDLPQDQLAMPDYRIEKDKISIDQLNEAKQES